MARSHDYGNGGDIDLGGNGAAVYTRFGEHRCPNQLGFKSHMDDWAYAGGRPGVKRESLTKGLWWHQVV